MSGRFPPSAFRLPLQIAVLLVVGCGAGEKHAEIPKLPAAKPEAVEALKDAARLVRLGPGNHERVLERLKDAVEIDPQLWEAWYDAGWLELQRHHTDEAIAALEKAQSILPSHAPTVEALAQAYVQAGRAADAVKVLRGFLDKQPSAKEANVVRVQLANALRRYNK